jgi:hypothetical protein
VRFGVLRLTGQGDPCRAFRGVAGAALTRQP